MNGATHRRNPELELREEAGRSGDSPPGGDGPLQPRRENLDRNAQLLRRFDV